MCINIAQGVIVFIDRVKKMPSCSLFITEYAFDNGLKCSVSYASQNLENRKQKIKKNKKDGSDNHVRPTFIIAK